MNANPTVLAYLLLALTTLFWGGNSVAGRMAVGEISPMLLTAGRWGIAFLILAALGWREIRAEAATIRANRLWLAVMAFIGFAFFNICLYIALHYTTAVNSSVLQAAMPVFVFAASYFWHGQRTRAGQIVGFVVTLAGVAVIAAEGSLSTFATMSFNPGDLLVIGAIAVYGLYTVALRDKPALHWKSLMAALTALAFLTSLPFAIAEAALGYAQAPTPTGWALLAYTAIFPSILAQVFWIRGNELIGANRAGLFINLVPVFGTLLAILILGERLHGYHAVALALVMGGIAIAEKRKGR
ncbi:MAG: DMT family transporter [Rhizobiaceae bacterium]